jgi:hypothetical protein
MCNYYASSESPCTIHPEPITRGGLEYRFVNNMRWYKTIRLNIDKWPWITPNTEAEWRDNEEVLLESGETINLFLKSFHGAPVFTLEELRDLEHLFNLIGFTRFGRYPGKKRLVDKEGMFTR